MTMQPGEERDFAAQVFVLTSTGETGSSSSPELCLGKQDPCWVYMLQFPGICLIGNAWCRTSSRGFLGPGLTSSLSMWSYLSSSQRARGLTQQIMVCHAGMVCPALANEAKGWGKHPLTIENQGLWSSLLSQNCNLFFVFYYAYSISPLKLVD